MSCEDHRRPNDVLPSRNHPDFHSQPQRSRAQLQAGQRLKDRSLPAQSKAALQVSTAPYVASLPAAPSSHYRFCCVPVCTVIRLRVTRTPETSGSTCRLCRSTCRGRPSSTPRLRTTTWACSSIRSGFNKTFCFNQRKMLLLCHFNTFFFSRIFKLLYKRIK